MSKASPTSQAIDEILAAQTVPRFRELGFRRTGRSLWRASGDVLHCIHFQASQWNDPREGRFTANLQIVWPRWHEVWTGKPLPKNPASAATVAHQRAGWFMPGRQDHWWTVRPGMDTKDVAREVATVMEHAAAEFFARYAASASVLARMENGETPPGVVPHVLVRMVLLASAGREAEARSLMERERAANPRWYASEAVRSCIARVLPPA